VVTHALVSNELEASLVRTLRLVHRKMCLFRVMIAIASITSTVMRERSLASSSVYLRVAGA
jgi:hypothetical protein